MDRTPAVWRIEAQYCEVGFVTKFISFRLHRVSEVFSLRHSRNEMGMKQHIKAYSGVKA
jgi:hypothetical protein